MERFRVGKLAVGVVVVVSVLAVNDEVTRSATRVNVVDDDDDDSAQKGRTMVGRKREGDGKIEPLFSFLCTCCCCSCWMSLGCCFCKVLRFFVVTLL